MASTTNDLGHHSRLSKVAALEMSEASMIPSAEVVIRQGLMREFPSASMPANKKAAAELVLKPADAVITLNKEGYSAKELRKKVADSIEEQAKKREDAIYDLQFMHAQSFENINNETSVLEEYFRWMATGKEIIKDMNDGEVTQQDIDAKHGFIGHLGQREAELITCLALYQASKSPEAKERYDELRMKLSKLREIRSAIENATTDRVDHRTIKEEYENAKKYVKAINLLPTLSLLAKTKLAMDTGDYSDDSYEKMYYYHMVRHALHYAHTAHNQNESGQAERLLRIRQNKVRTIADLRKRMDELSGRRQVFSEAQQQAPAFVEQIRNRRFDKEKYMVLNKENSA